MKIAKEYTNDVEFSTEDAVRSDISSEEQRRVLLRLKLPERPAGDFAAGWVKLEWQAGSGGELFTEICELALEYGSFGAFLAETVNRYIAWR